MIETIIGIALLIELALGLLLYYRSAKADWEKSCNDSNQWKGFFQAMEASAHTKPRDSK